jgi:drug/metabolite transporter (DMT)-like permease
MTPSTPAVLPPRSAWPPYLALGVGIVTLAFSPIFVRWANAPGPVAGFYRTTIAALVMAGPFWYRLRLKGQGAHLGQPAAIEWRGARLALLGGVFFGGDLALWGTGVVMSGASNPSLLANMAPLWVGLGALVFFRERLRPLFWGGLVLALSGAVAVVGLDALRAPTLGLGSLLGLVAGVFYAGYFLFTQRGRESLDSVSYFWLAAVASAVVLLAVTRAFGQPLTGYTPTVYLLFAATGLLCQVMGYLSINYALGYLPASIVSPIMLIQPMVTVALAAPLLGERLLPGQIVGAVAVLAGVYVVHHSRLGAA